MSRRRKPEPNQLGFVFTFFNENGSKAEQASKNQEKPAPEPVEELSAEKRLEKLRVEQVELRKLEKDMVTYPQGSKARKELLARKAHVHDEILKITNPEYFEEEEKEKIEAEKEKKYKEKRSKQKYNEDSWETARELRDKKIELSKLNNEELQEKYEEVIKDIPPLYIHTDKEVQVYVNEKNRRKELEIQKKSGFTPTGEDVTVIPNFILNVTSVARHARKEKDRYFGKRIEEERYFVNKLLFYKEYEAMTKTGRKKKAFESVVYTGYELSMEEILVFLALIKNTIEKQRNGENPWGILKCRKGDIIDFVGWNKKTGGKFYEKVIRSLRVLTHGTWTIESGKAMFCGHLVDNVCLSKEEVVSETGQNVDELQDLNRGEFYYRISPPLIALFKQCFFKANISAIKNFLYEDKRPNDLKAWFYLYLMSLYYREEKGEQIVQGRHGLVKQAVMVPKFPACINLADIKKQTGYVGELKELKRQILPAISSVAIYFEQNGGVFHAEWDSQDKYKLNLKEFKKPRLHDIVEEKGFDWYEIITNE